MTQSNQRKLTIARAMAEAVAQEMRVDVELSAGE